MPDAEFDPPEKPQLLSLGLVVGGPSPANELVREALMALMRHVKAQSANYSNDGLRINIVFKLPGPLMAPEFEGVFPARLARKTNHLLVNAAVPTGLTFEQVPEYFAQALRETKEAANAYLQKRKINVDTTNVMAMIDDLVKERA